eukprot:TRINITY_DN16461_c0_g1_i1.p1 TRINITY_DN16461_c0_g1~~TRINITY_DN16461_c0_g1_i1.p1  ORF type:complete len:575 (-),score=94.74 TRINITY_DN16461_c0_g1_i1:40-1713(-)
MEARGGHSYSRSASFLSDVESNFEIEEDGDPCSDKEETASLLEARDLAREKFEWLTCKALVAKSRAEGHDGREHGVSFGKSVIDSDGGLRSRPNMPPQTPVADQRMSAPGSYRSSAEYLAACSRYNLTPNGGALLGLSLGLEELEADGLMTNLELVPFCSSLLHAPFVKHLKLSGHPLQDTGAAVLALALPGCPWIQEVELVDCKITGSGIRSICQTVPKSGVRRLVLRGNLFRQNSSMANTALGQMVEASEQLESLDLKSSGLHSEGMRQIKKALAIRAELGYPVCSVDFEGNFVLVEVLNSVTHGACALITLEGWRRLNTLIVRLCHFNSRMAVFLYIASMMCMFLGSTLYHSMFAVTDLAWFFKMIDHCAIYFLIAGTYTPVLVMGCRHPETMEIRKGVQLLCFIYWSLVLFGVIMEHFFANWKPSWYSKFILFMYILLGFGGVPYISSCKLVRSADVMGWIEIGGLMYVVGIVFFLLDRRYPSMHVIWHLFVGGAAFFHFIGVWNLTNEVLSEPHRRCNGTGIWGDGPFEDIKPSVLFFQSDDESWTSTSLLR